MKDVALQIIAKVTHGFDHTLMSVAVTLSRVKNGKSFHIHGNDFALTHVVFQLQNELIKVTTNSGTRSHTPNDQPRW